MGKQWDTGEVAFSAEFWAEVYRVLKPGGHVAAFGSSRGYHRMACAIEDAGFEIRDSLMWIYGTGFPKSHNVSKGIDKAAGAKGEFGAKKANVHSRGDHILNEGWKRPWMDDPAAVDNSGREYLPATHAARQWQGWGTALKPAFEMIVLARKPLSEKTVAANIMKWGTGAINVSACRVLPGRILDAPMDAGRWPANIVHDGSDEVVGMFPQQKPSRAASGGTFGGNDIYGDFSSSNDEKPSVRGHSDNGGSAARFFYSAKADSDSRLGSKHPTVKPVDLMQWLVRLVTPKGGLVLDPFAGTGTTAEASFYEGMRCTLIEREQEYCVDIARRMELILAGPMQRTIASACGREAPPLPLFEDLP
jgi:site-specific DNA-methyltransferase (adenine-specific)